MNDTGEFRANGANKEQSHHTPALSETDLSRLEEMSREEMMGLIKSVSGAMWGIGLQTQEEREEALLLKLITLALTRDDAKEVVSLAKEYFDRMRGRPAQSIDLNQKVGIVAIVLEAAKQRKHTEPIVIEG